LIPLRDSIQTTRVPVVNWLLIAACALVFLLQLDESREDSGITEALALIPARLSHPDQPVTIAVGEMVDRFGRVRTVARVAERAAVPEWLTLLTCTFLHGGLLHIVGNMLFLWIFGDNVEERLGRLRYLVFYLGCGTAASLAHYLSDPESTMPTVGASGAIAGVMGAYLVLYPHAKVLTLVPIFFFLELVVLPAPLFLGVWFVLQLFQGVASLGSVATGGVAWWAHIGGFGVGAAVAALLRAGGQLRPAPPAFTLTRRRFGPPRTGW